uniref:Transmembrane protein n=1 Tax=Heterorhabditis bacteriophora TaxID=37862 RepID=A0A1I7XEV5_HETBA
MSKPPSPVERLNGAAQSLQIRNALERIHAHQRDKTRFTAMTSGIRDAIKLNSHHNMIEKLRLIALLICLLFLLTHPTLACLGGLGGGGCCGQPSCPGPCPAYGK